MHRFDFEKIESKDFKKVADLRLGVDGEGGDWMINNRGRGDSVIGHR